jgi:hypothetical protein
LDEIVVNVDIDNIWKAFPWDESLKVGRHWKFFFYAILE